MTHIIKSVILFVAALVLFALTLWLGHDWLTELAKTALLKDLARPLIYTAIVAVYFDLLVLITEALPISRY